LPSTEGLSLEGEWPFGYQEALAEVSEQLQASDLACVETEHARWRARRECHSLLIDERGLALAWQR
jgi:hypothetical protein